jgi:hypothetical protein
MNDCINQSINRVGNRPPKNRRAHKITDHDYLQLILIQTLILKEDFAMKTTIFQGISEGLSFSNQQFFPYGPSQVGDVPRLGD